MFARQAVRSTQLATQMIQSRAHSVVSGKLLFFKFSRESHVKPRIFCFILGPPQVKVSFGVSILASSIHWSCLWFYLVRLSREILEKWLRNETDSQLKSTSSSTTQYLIVSLFSFIVNFRKRLPTVPWCLSAGSQFQSGSSHTWRNTKDRSKFSSQFN